MKSLQILSLLFCLYSVAFAQSFCNANSHSGQSLTLNSNDSNRKGRHGTVDYEVWADGGNNSATFYSDGSFSCKFSNTKDYLCRTGVQFSSSKYPSEIGHITAEYKVVKQNTQNVGYSYVGVYGWTLNSGISGVFEFYIVDNWLSQWRPGDWVGNEKKGNFYIDGGEYTVYKNVNGNLTQYFSLRTSPRTCGTIDVTAHFEQWEKIGLKMGRIDEVKVLGEAGNVNGGCSGTVDFPYAKVYINGVEVNTNGKPNNTNPGNTGNATNPPKCSSKITQLGYKCCSDKCTVQYVDNDGYWGIENNQWCGCGTEAPKCVGKQGYPCCSNTRDVVYRDNDGNWGIENNDWCLIA